MYIPARSGITQGCTSGGEDYFNARPTLLFETRSPTPSTQRIAAVGVRGRAGLMIAVWVLFLGCHCLGRWWYMYVYVWAEIRDLWWYILLMSIRYMYI